ncbi:tRNA preQ1(34) S-adenosylmethionine ribosyltransferase-isomerase QueA [Candidatus Tisiphia endosymbiont of Nemotelus uliginosus]|uniref:tRNA preQ1(34) S-adenosylmethionine ribosyltransferase-isomerase QueA n=1 Tax=Candidatus Tisiphia endosymbiont of Nemotelus uliginosus TaxID=3077926 RepID=UPI0035C8EC93
MILSNFDFTLPHTLIAQEPEPKRDNSSLLIANLNNPLVQCKFYTIIDYLLPGDVMVFNDSKVINAKLLLDKEGRRIELYLNKQIGPNKCHGFTKPAKKLKERDQFDFDGNNIIILHKLNFGQVEVKFELSNISVFEFLEKYGQIPLPPYIKRPENLIEDNIRYQTVYNKHPGAVAAPTAGLHFSTQLLHLIKRKGVEIVFITLHVGAGTFLPIKTEDIDQHMMHGEYYHINRATANIINKAKKEHRRIIAVGSTALRALESAAIDEQVQDGGFETEIFIKPGFKFQIVDLLLTNFHLPKSTLFILVCAFVGSQEAVNIYQYAIEHKMRFFSYGDASLLYLKK